MTSNLNFEELTKLRKFFHENPELSCEEKSTAKTLHEQLEKAQPTLIIPKLGGHGILAVFDSGKPGPTVVLRADMDALPIQEINDFEHQSKMPGVSHKCGHDGHSAMLVGTAQVLAQHPPLRGKVALLFQPAEENGVGAAAVLVDEKWTVIEPDWIFALHNLPGFKAGEIVVREHTFTAAVNSIIIKLKGKTSHAAEPEHGLNPALALSKIIDGSLAFDLNDPENEAMRVVTIVSVTLGELAYGISAGNAELHLTVRCWNDENLRQLEADIVSLAKRVALEEGLQVAIDYTQSFHANQNHPEAVQVVKLAAQNAKIALLEKRTPFKWGEDFGLFTAKYRGCMFGLGAGETMPALHNPDYDFPDEITESGVLIFSHILHEILELKDV